MSKKEIKRILFYHGLVRALRTTLIGHLYSLCQVYPVVLLSDGLDEETKAIVQNKKLFPKLEKIIFVPPEPKSKIQMFKYHKEIRDLMKNTIDHYKPNVIIAPNDTYPPELYLFRFGKKLNALCLALQSSLELDMAQLRKAVNLANAYLRFPKTFPKFFRFFLTAVRQYALHFSSYWLGPLLSGEKPFFGKSSYVLRNKSSGLRDIDYQIVFSQREYDMYRRFSLVPREKLYVLKHPLGVPSTRRFFKKNVLAQEGKVAKKTALLLMPSDEIGFRKKDQSLISKEEREKERIEIIEMLASRLPAWKIVVKPHPNFKSYEKTKETFELLSDRVKLVDPADSSDKYAAQSEIVIGLPRSASTALFTASLLFPKKPILSLDFDKELLGDTYKGVQGIEYIDSQERFAEVLGLIKRGKYTKERVKTYQSSKDKEFSNIVLLLNYLLQKT